jgi:hypothetical protein
MLEALLLLLRANFNTLNYPLAHSINPNSAVIFRQQDCRLPPINRYLISSLSTMFSSSRTFPSQPPSAKQTTHGQIASSSCDKCAPALVICVFLMPFILLLYFTGNVVAHLPLVLLPNLSPANAFFA